VPEDQLSDRANQKRREELSRFYRSGIHQDYRSYVVDRDGASATTWLRNWLIDQA
jgi:hypothetical protein